MRPDIEKYMRHVDHLDMSQDDKIKFIHTMWSIMEAFADKAFGLDATSLATLANTEFVARPDSALVHSINADDPSLNQG